MFPLTPIPAACVTGPPVLQVFSQYLKAGGEEVWVNQILRLGNICFQINDLRFQSRA